MKELDINKISKGKSKNIKIGELTPDVISVLNLKLNPQNINIWSTRIYEHCEKHKNEYSSPSAYNEAVKSIPLILEEPDYIGMHSNGNIQYIKKLDDITLLGIKVIKGNGGLLFRTLFPISQSKLEHNIRIGNYIPFNKNQETP